MEKVKAILKQKIETQLKDIKRYIKKGRLILLMRVLLLLSFTILFSVGLLKNDIFIMLINGVLILIWIWFVVDILQDLSQLKYLYKEITEQMKRISSDKVVMHTVIECDIEDLPEVIQNVITGLYDDNEEEEA